MNVKFLPEAHAELLDAVAYYEGELSGLGLRLWEDSGSARRMDRAKLRSAAPADRWLPPSEPEKIPILHSHIVREPVIWTLAVAHGHTRPEYWINRPRTVG